MPGTSQVGTIIGRGVTIKGNLSSEEDLMIDGKLEGTLDLGQHRLVVGPDAQISAKITAREVEVQGVVNGNIEAVEKVTLGKASKVIGDMKMAVVVIEDGAYFKGCIEISRPEAAASPTVTVPEKPPDLPSAG